MNKEKSDSVSIKVPRILTDCLDNPDMPLIARETIAHTVAEEIVFKASRPRLLRGIAWWWHSYPIMGASLHYYIYSYTHPIVACDGTSTFCCYFWYRACCSGDSFKHFRGLVIVK